MGLLPSVVAHNGANVWRSSSIWEADMKHSLAIVMWFAVVVFGSLEQPSVHDLVMPFLIPSCSCLAVEASILCHTNLL